ncbi:hypothetical protein ES708_13674 [subsurface metagenome]
MLMYGMTARAWLQPIMRAAAAQKYPWTRLYQELKEVVPVYRKTEFGYDYRSYTSAYAKGERLKYVRLDYKPSADLFSEARVGMRKTFKYNVESRFVDRQGGVYSTRSSFVSSDRQLTRGEIEDIVRDRVSDIAEDYDCPTVATTLTEAWHREGEFWD